MCGFNSIIGHDFIKNSLKKALDANRIAHAYILDGGDGVGKRLMANVFAKTLNCEKSSLQPCNECISCRAFSGGNNPDIIYPKPTKGQVLGIDDIREQVNAKAYIKPYKYKYKIFILDNASEMTVQAQNALLKTLEEPPGYAVFILISQNYRRFLPTIISRCVVYRLKEISTEEIEKFLKSKGYKDNDIIAALAFCGGSIGKALALLEDDTFKEDREEISTLLSSLANITLEEVFLAAKNLEKFKDRSDRLLDILYIWYRDAIVLKSTDGQIALMQRSSAKNINAFSQQMSLEKLIYGIDSVIEARASLSRNGNYLLTMEAMLMKMTGF